MSGINRYACKYYTFPTIKIFFKGPRPFKQQKNVIKWLNNY
jgi:hypothetical protein